MTVKRKWALPLVPLYAAGLVVKNGLRAAGFPKTRKLPWPVVSVGSLSAGGAGKTPVVIALARLLSADGFMVDVLSRGYGRQGSAIRRVVTNLRDGSLEFGDEPVLISRATGVPVWVGSDRYAAGCAAEAEEHHRRTLKSQQKKNAAEEVDGASPGPGVHLLDDGFQHRRLARTVNIVLVMAEDVHDALLPAGNLREPLKALRRADVVVLREEERRGGGGEVSGPERRVERADVEAVLRGFMAAGALLWRVRRKLQFPAPLGVLSAGLRPIAFCAIARPEGFAAMLAAAGCGTVETVAFADHHRYSAADITSLMALAKKVRASGFVTTEKDAVKLTRELRGRLAEIGPVIVVGLDVEFVDEAAVMSELESRLR